MISSDKIYKGLHLIFQALQLFFFFMIKKYPVKTHLFLNTLLEILWVWSSVKAICRQIRHLVGQEVLE